MREWERNQIVRRRSKVQILKVTETSLHNENNANNAFFSAEKCIDLLINKINWETNSKINIEACEVIG